MDRGTSVLPSFVVERLPEIQRPATLRLLIAIGVFMNRESNECFPSARTLQTEAGIKHKASYHKAVRELETLGIIERYPRPRRLGGYHIIIQWTHASGGAGSSPPQGVGGDTTDRPPRPRAGVQRRGSGGLRDARTGGLAGGPLTPNLTRKGTQGGSTAEEEKPQEKVARLKRSLETLRHLGAPESNRGYQETVRQLAEAEGEVERLSEVPT